MFPLPCGVYIRLAPPPRPIAWGVSTSSRCPPPLYLVSPRLYSASLTSTPQLPAPTAVTPLAWLFWRRFAMEGASSSRAPPPQRSKQDLVRALLAAKEASGKTLTQIAGEVRCTNAYIGQLLLRQAPLASDRTADRLARALRRASDDDARRWSAQNTEFWAMVIAPWVIVQEIDATSGESPSPQSKKLH